MNESIHAIILTEILSLLPNSNIQPFGLDDPDAGTGFIHIYKKRRYTIDILISGFKVTIKLHSDILPKQTPLILNILDDQILEKIIPYIKESFTNHITKIDNLQPIT
jgi:hypothetical protein